jgi:hypothetical protein
MDFQPMSPDDMQRTMQFLLDHQAKFAADLDKLTERFDGTSERFERLVDKTERIADGVISLTTVVGQVAARVDRLHDVVVQHLRRDHGYTDL